MKFRRWKEGGKGWNESIEAVFFEMKVCLASLIVDSLWITDLGEQYSSISSGRHFEWFRWLWISSDGLRDLKNDVTFFQRVRMRPR